MSDALYRGVTLSRHCFNGLKLLGALLLLVSAGGCSPSSSGSPPSTAVTAVASYCPYISSPKSYPSPVTVTGQAFYEFRANGNGVVADGSKTIAASIATITIGQSYSLTVNSTPFTFTCSVASCSSSTGLAALVASINGTSSLGATAAVSSAKLVLSPSLEGTPFTVSAFTNMTPDTSHTISFTPTISNGQKYELIINGTTFTFNCTVATCTAATAVSKLSSDINGTGFTTAAFKGVAMTNNSTLLLGAKTEANTVVVTGLTNVTDSQGIEPNPIRYAEVQALDSSGNIVQCAETDSTGAFSMSLPSGGSTYTIKAVARANNSFNTAYILSNPTDNALYSVSSTVVASGSPPALRLIAKASGTLAGGAFNILDQIYRAQSFVRSQTNGCSTNSSTNYFSDCQPVSTIPLLYVYWSPGLNPGTYVGTSGGLSFYILNSTGSTTLPHGLYILGGIGGDVDTSDMDHFDNSVIVHEYGHFIEDTFGKMNSPGGSHNGNSIVDARLAWGEGWADFFQAAVTGNPIYRDTYGHFGCGNSCTGVNFNEFLDPTGGTYDDQPSAGSPGEGNFHEFAITRTLWDVIKPGGTSQFSEIWTVMNGATHGMKVVNDVFKSLGRFLLIQTGVAGKTDWSSLATNEEQVQNLSVYGNTLVTTGGCAPSSTAMVIKKVASDDGSFSASNQYQNNAFYSYAHSGGNLTIHLTWSGASNADLDLYLYKAGYSFGSDSSIIARDDATSTTTSGSATISQTVAAGNYMINIMAFTGLYSSPGTFNTTYTLTINGQTACPAP
jgi:hypothetical protein